MSYTSNKAPGRVAPTKAKDAQFSKDSRNAASDKQAKSELGAPQSSKFRTVTPKLDKGVQPTYTAKAGYNEGNYVRLQPNTKGTNVVGRPTGVALGDKRKVFGGVENPDGKVNQTTAKYD